MVTASFSSDRCDLGFSELLLGVQIKSKVDSFSRHSSMGTSFQQLFIQYFDFSAGCGAFARGVTNLCRGNVVKSNCTAHLLCR